MNAFWQDIKHSLRMFWRSPGFTIAAVAALALGIGTNTAIFSVLNAVLLKPVPIPEPDRVVLFLNVSPQGSGPAASPAKFAHWSAQTSVIQDAAAFLTGVVNLTGSDVPEQLRSAQVTVNFFRLFGVPVLRGRTFSREEDLPRGEKVVLVGQALWERRFGGDPQILGKTISLGGDPYVVIGVVSSKFDFREFGAQPDVYTAFQLDPNTSDQGHYFQAGARLKPGVTLAQAKERLRASADE